MKEKTFFKTLASTTLLATFAILLNTSFINKTYAYGDIMVEEEKTRYVNSTLIDIDADKYNEMIRKITNDEYNSLSEEQKKEYDSKFLAYGKDAKGGIQNGYNKDNTNDNKQKKAITQGLVKERLINGELYTKDNFANSNTLFPLNNLNDLDRSIYKNVLGNWKFPLLEYEDGSMGFKSTLNHLYQVSEDKMFQPHYNTYGYGYFPFSNCDYDMTHMHTTYIEFEIYVSQDGKVTNRNTGNVEDITINVNNDDDLWLFIDDELAIDNGGIHDEAKATYNVATNQVNYESIYDQNTDTEKNNVIKQGLNSGKLKEGAHTIKIFHSDRYGWPSQFEFTTNAKFIAANINYIDKDTNESMKTIKVPAHRGENFVSEAKTFDNFKLIQEPETNSYTASNETKEINYYYGKKHTLTMRYVDYYSNEKIAEDIILKLYEGEHYDENEKEIKNYRLYISPSNREGEMPENDEIVTYSYVYTNAKITANYIDKKTNQILTTDEKIGTENRKAKFEEKQIDGYKLVQTPTDDEITFTKKDKTVNFYYEKEHNLTINYIDKITNANLETINKKMIEGEKFNLEEKAFERYKLFESPNISEFIMQDKDVILNYYYIYQTKIKINHVDKKTGEVIEEYEEFRNEGETYRSNEGRFENYIIIEKPKNEENILTKEDLTITYYYRKLKFNLNIKMEMKKAYINENYYELEGKLDKIETQIREANSSSDVRIFYKLRISNDSERRGSATIKVKIPKGYVAIESNIYKINDDNTLTINVEDMGPNDLWEIEIIIKKNEERDISEIVTTTAYIESTSVEESNLKDNEAKCELVIMPRTGAKQMAIHGIICMTIITFLVCLVLKKDNKIRRELNIDKNTK